MDQEYLAVALAVAQVILKEREERKQNRVLEERDPMRLPCEVSQEPQASEELTEGSSAQESHEPTSIHVILYYTPAILGVFQELIFRLNCCCSS